MKEYNNIIIQQDKQNNMFNSQKKNILLISWGKGNTPAFMFTLLYQM